MRSQSAASESSSEHLYRYYIYIWDGFDTTNQTRATALVRANELDQLFLKAKDSVLKVIFSGGVVKGNKLQRGSVFLLADILNRKNHAGSS